MNSSMTAMQWRRLSAYAKIVNEERDLLTSYRGDLVYDGAILVETTGPIVVCIRDMGTHISNRPEDVESTRKVFGETDGQSHFYYGSEEKGEFTFRRVTAEEAIELLEKHAEVTT